MERPQLLRENPIMTFSVLPKKVSSCFLMNVGIPYAWSSPEGRVMWVGSDFSLDLLGQQHRVVS